MDDRFGAALRPLWLGLIAAATAYLAWKAFFFGQLAIDFRYVWLAGQIWSEGQSPYGAGFLERGGEIFMGDHRGLFLYPPNWWTIATALAETGFEQATLIWRGVGFACYAAGCAIVVAGLRRAVDPPLWRVALFVAFAFTMIATPQNLTSGQTAALPFLGVCIFVNAWITRRRLPMVAALALLMLKPQFGFLAAAFLAPVLFWWPPLAAGAVVVLASAAPAFLSVGLVETLDGMAESLATYSGFFANHPANMTGLRNALHDFFGISVGGVHWFAVSNLLAFLLGVAVSRPATQASPATAMALFVAMLFALTALHTYDLTFVSLLILLAARRPSLAALLVVAALALLYRANLLAEATGYINAVGEQLPGARVATLASILCVLGVGAMWWRERSGARSRPAGE